jgi:LysR family transcriptional regulator (chromosome initiation inhibitor)
MLAFNRKDHLQSRWVTLKTGRKLFPPTHFLPSTHGFVHVARSGACWGMNPISLVQEDLTRGTLVALDPELFLDVPLYLQISRRMRPALSGLESAIRQAAKDALIS